MKTGFAWGTCIVLGALITSMVAGDAEARHHRRRGCGGGYSNSCGSGCGASTGCASGGCQASAGSCCNSGYANATVAQPYQAGYRGVQQQGQFQAPVADPNADLAPSSPSDSAPPKPQ